MPDSPFPQPRRLISKIETAEVVHMHPVSLMKRARTDPDFPRAIRLGSKIFFDFDEIEAWIERCRLPKKGEPTKPDTLAGRADHLVERRRAKSATPNDAA